MKLVRPLTVTDAVLTGSNVYETVPSAYNGGTTYALGAIVSVSGANNSHKVYQSLEAGNTGNAPASSPTKWREKGTVYSAYNGATAYVTGDIVTDTTNHLIYESVDGSTGAALTDATEWTLLGASNKWGAFDGATGALTTWEGSVQFELTAAGRVDTLCLFNLSASSVNVTYEVDAVEVHNEDYNLTSSDGIDGMWSWFLEPIKRRTDLAIEDLPIDLGPVVTITVTGGGDVSVGEIVAGQSRTLGSTQYDLSLGITDYSRIDADDFGVRSIVQRAYVKRMDAAVWVDADETSFVFDLLASLRATPVALIGSSSYSATVQYGLLKDWRVRIAYPSHSILDLEFEGL